MNVRETLVTNDVDFNLSRDGRNIILQLQSVSAFVWTDAWRNRQLRMRWLGHYGDTLVFSGQLLFSKGPLRDGGWISSDWDSDGERMRNNHLQAIPEGTQVKGRPNCQERDIFLILRDICLLNNASASTRFKQTSSCSLQDKNREYKGHPFSRISHKILDEKLCNLNYQNESKPLRF